MNSKEYISSGIIEAYILGLASAEEASILECIMKNNAEVKEAFEEAQKTIEDLATAHAVAPPAELKAKIWDKIRQEENVKSLTPNENEQVLEPDATGFSIEKPTLKIHKANIWKNFAVAASVLFLISIAGHLFWMSNQDKKQNEIEKLRTETASQNVVLQKLQKKWNMISNPDMQMITLKGVVQHPDVKATVFWDKKLKKVYLNAGNLPEAPEGMQYQLWAIADGKPVNAGMYTDEENGEMPLSVIPNAQAFAITLEKKGGSESPTMENMYVMGEV